MGLSEREQQLLEELERSLTSGENPPKDPKLPLSPTEQGPRRIVLGLLIMVAGFGVLLTAAISRLPFLGLVGFLVMATGAIVASSRRQHSI